MAVSTGEKFKVHLKIGYHETEAMFSWDIFKTILERGSYLKDNWIWIITLVGHVFLFIIWSKIELIFARLKKKVTK